MSRGDLRFSKKEKVRSLSAVGTPSSTFQMACINVSEQQTHEPSSTVIATTNRFKLHKNVCLINTCNLSSLPFFSLPLDKLYISHYYIDLFLTIMSLLPSLSLLSMISQFFNNCNGASVPRKLRSGACLSNSKSKPLNVVMHNMHFPLYFLF